MQIPNLLPQEPHIHGPTWRRHEDGSWWLPEYSLGWGVFDWWYDNVLQPTGPRAGEPFIPTLEQARFVLWWYALEANSMRFIYRKSLLRRLKGWGKDPLVAALSLAELGGPIQPHFWTENTEPVGKRRHSAWIQIAAVSQDQTRNTFTLFPSMISRPLKQQLGLEVNKTIIYTNDGGMIEGVTSSPMSLEGKRPTFVVKNETQWWVEANAGHEMSGVIQGNADKSAYGGCRVMSICNAHVPGLDSDAERDWEVYQLVNSKQAVDTGLLYDSLEAPADTPVSEIPPASDDPDGFNEGVKRLRDGLLIARGDAEWLDLDYLVQSILDIKNPISESRRKFLNQINAAEDSWISPVEWDRIKRDVYLLPRERITLGFDGSKKQDFTALVACRVSDGALFTLRIWDPKNFASDVFTAEVDAQVRSVFKKYDVVGFRCDVKEWESYIDTWTRDFGRQLKVKANGNSVIGYDLRGNQKRFALDCERFLSAVLDQEVTHDGNPGLRQHVLNAHRHPTNYDAVVIRKATRDSSRKIDAAVAAVLAFGSRQDLVTTKRGHSGQIVSIR